MLDIPPPVIKWVKKILIGAYHAKEELQHLIMEIKEKIYNYITFCCFINFYDYCL